MSCQKLTLSDIKLTPEQLAALLNGIRKDQTMKKIHLSSIDFVFQNVTTTFI